MKVVSLEHYTWFFLYTDFLFVHFSSFIQAYKHYTLNRACLFHFFLLLTNLLHSKLMPHYCSTMLPLKAMFTFPLNLKEKSFASAKIILHRIFSRPSYPNLYAFNTLISMVWNLFTILHNKITWMLSKNKYRMVYNTHIQHITKTNVSHNISQIRRNWNENLIWRIYIAFLQVHWTDLSNAS